MFGFLKEKLKQTVEKLTKEVDQATQKVEPTEDQKKEMIEEIKKEQEEKKGFFSKLKEKFTKRESVEEDKGEKPKEEQQTKKEKREETKQKLVKEEKKEPSVKKHGEPIKHKEKETHKPKKEVILEKKHVDVVEKKVEVEERATPTPEKKEIPKEVLAKKIEEGEKEIEEIVAKKTEKREEKPAKETKHKEERKEEKPKEEQKGFFARLKDKFIAKEEQEEGKHSEPKVRNALETQKEFQMKEEKPFETSEEELKEFEEAFKEKEETQKETREKVDEAEEIIPVVTETETGETVFEIQQKPGTKHEEHSEPKVRNALETQKEFQMKRKETAKREEAEVIEEQEEEQKEVVVEEEKEESGFFSALKNTIFKTSLSEEKFEELFWELEMVLLENNVAVEVIELMKQNLKKDLVEKKILRGEINDIILRSLQKSVEQTFDVPNIDFIEKVKEKKPFIVVFVGINGSGKTTTIAKIAHKLKENNLSCVIAAGDTFRAAAIQQLEEHANRLHIKMIKHDYGSDPAAVGFDAIKYAQAHNIDCVLIDTAGRLHSNTNLMDEMKKIIRVTKPDLKVFIGEAITGNDCVDQARKFHEAIGIDAIVLAKADVDEKGGAALSISYVTKKPILYIGTGQGYNDLQPFDKEKVMEQIGLI